MNPLTEYLSSVKEHEKKAHKGPWTYNNRSSNGVIWGQEGEYIVGDARTVDAAFIAHARTDIPLLLAIVRKQAETLTSLAAGYSRPHELLKALNSEILTLIEAATKP